MLAPSGGGLILYQAYDNLYAMTGRKAHLLEDKQIPSVRVFDKASFYTLFRALGWLLEEIHMTWAHLEEKRTRLQTYTKILEDLCSHSVETASPLSSDDVRTYEDAPTSATTIVPNTPDDITNDVPEETQAKIPSLVPPKPFVSIRKSSMSIDQPSWLKDFVTAKYKALMAPYVPTIAKQHVYPLFHDKDFKAISSKWFYKIKYLPDGIVERYNKRLVIRGFNQKEDDILITRNSTNDISDTKLSLNKKFTIKDLELVTRSL
ncbi:hypothetical protein Tco_0210038 [Tanacetum coccineum]